jgi:hypothetical protein
MGLDCRIARVKWQKSDKNRAKRGKKLAKLGFFRQFLLMGRGFALFVDEQRLT